MYEDLTVLAVDSDEVGRAQLVTALRRLGLRALGVPRPEDAVGLLAGLDAEIVLVRGGEGCEHALEELRRRVPLVVVTPLEATVEETMVELLRVLGRPEEAANLN
jgi:hypothetical protein